MQVGDLSEAFLIDPERRLEIPFDFTTTWKHHLSQRMEKKTHVSVQMTLITIAIIRPYQL
jgi:hypothetical protein